MRKRLAHKDWEGFIGFTGIGVRWKIIPRSTSIHAFQSIPGVSILNPFAYSGCYRRNGILSEEPFRLNGGPVFLETTGFVCGMKVGYKFVQTDPDLLLNKFKNFFKHVRAESLQYDIDYRWMGSFGVVTDEDLDSRRVSVKNQKYIGTQSPLVTTALTWADMIRADRQLASGASTPVQNDLVLDAVDAHFSGDFRRSMLYFCMAAEVAVSTKLEIGAKRLQTNDPIFKLLSESWQFRFKLHEHFLYIYKRSLRQDNQTLYDDLLKLYATRNKIVHEGGIGQTALPIDRSGSEQAFDLVIDLFGWLGDTRLSIFKQRGFEWFGDITGD